jgi:hypothetical protein
MRERDRMSEGLDYESRNAPAPAPRSPVRSLRAGVAVVLNVLSALAGAFLSVYVFAAITDRGGGENWAAVGVLYFGMLVVPFQFVALLVSLAVTAREVPGTEHATRRWARWTAAAGIAIPVLAAAVAYLVVKLR